MLAEFAPLSGASDARRVPEACWDEDDPIEFERGARLLVQILVVKTSTVMPPYRCILSDLLHRLPDRL